MDFISIGKCVINLCNVAYAKKIEGGDVLVYFTAPKDGKNYAVKISGTMAENFWNNLQGRAERIEGDGGVFNI